MSKKRPLKKTDQELSESDGKVWYHEKHSTSGKEAKSAYWPNFLSVSEAEALSELFLKLSKLEGGPFHNMMYLPFFSKPGEKKTLQKKEHHRIAFFTSTKENGHPIKYKYAGYTEQGTLEWPKELWALKEIVERFFGVQYNAAFVNVYNDGTGIGAHSDNEPSIDQTVGIASISLGRSGRFFLQMIDNPKSTRKTITLEDRSLAMMYPGTQEIAKHGVNKTTSKALRGKHRINITFRKMKN